MLSALSRWSGQRAGRRSRIRRGLGLPLTCRHDVRRRVRRRVEVPQARLRPAQVSKSLKAEPRRQAESLKADVTGLLVKNIPSSVLQQEFLQALRDDGFEKQIDYCSLPSDWKTGLGRGQAWLNFRLASSAQALHRRYNGKRRFKNQEAPLQVVASHLQGLEANLTRCSLEAKCREVPFVALDALKAAEGHPPQPKIAAGAGRVPSSAPQGATSRKSSRPKTEGAKDKWAELSKLSKEPESKLLLLESEAESETAQVQPQQEQAGPQAPGRRRRKKDGLRKAAEDFEQLLAEERSRHAADRRSTPNASANAVTAPTKPPASCCCLCGKPVPNLKHAAELSACKAHYRTFQAEERSLAAFAATRQKSDEKAPTNHLFHLSAYLNRGEESPFITDLYLGGGIAFLATLIRFLVLRGHAMEERWHGLTAPFMSFVLLDYAPFLALAFADVLDLDTSRYPCVVSLRERAKAAMARWTPSKRLSGLTGHALDQTVADAVAASHDLVLPPEHMPLDAEPPFGPSSRKKKKKAKPAPAPPVHEESNVESDLEDIGNEAPPDMRHHTWHWLTCQDVSRWAIASRKQVRDYYKFSGCCDRKPSWGFLQEEEPFFAKDCDPGLDIDELDESSGLCLLSPAGAAGVEARAESETESEEDRQGEDGSDISTADAPSSQVKMAERQEITRNQGYVDAGLGTGAGTRQALWPMTLKGVLRQLLQQVPGLQKMARQHPCWLHLTLCDSFRLSACSKLHSALFEEAAALAVLRRQQMAEELLQESEWEDLDSVRSAVVGNCFQLFGR
ncbi:unnamed protein product [Effrenium voratum]|nr:unnamed protein product [Effrenium voratum]